MINTKSFSQKTELIYRVIANVWAYVLVGVLFVLFVIVNDGQLVVGDRDAHKATVNLPQLFYFFGIVVVFGAPHWLACLQPFLKASLKKWPVLLLAVVLAALIIRYNTVVHPYLLADNRHYVRNIIYKSYLENFKIYLLYNYARLSMFGKEFTNTIH